MDRPRNGRLNMTDRISWERSQGHLIADFHGARLFVRRTEKHSRSFHGKINGEIVARVTGESQCAAEVERIARERFASPADMTGIIKRIV